MRRIAQCIGRALCVGWLNQHKWKRVEGWEQHSPGVGVYCKYHECVRCGTRI